MPSSRKGKKPSSAKAKGGAKGGKGSATAKPSAKLPVNFSRAVGLPPTESPANSVAAVQKYLQRFGYLQPEEETSLAKSRGNLNVSALAARELALPKVRAIGTFDEATAEALFSFQTYYGLPPTGRLDMATAALMSRPRCGVPDIPDVPGAARFVARSRWDKLRLRYQFVNFTTQLSQGQIREAVRQAFRLWERVSQIKVTEARSGRADFEVGFFRDSHRPGCPPFDRLGGVLAHAFFPGSGGGFSGDTHFDDAERWSVDLPASGTDLVTVAAHEFGHALGLDHTSVHGALMFAFYGGPHRHLHADDVQGIQRLYGAADPEEDLDEPWI